MKPSLHGQVFSRLTVLRFSHSRKTPSGTTKNYWECRCACGKLHTTEVRLLRAGKSQSCGCQGAENRKLSTTTHGHGSKNSKHYKTYITWANMIQRCTNPESTFYFRYGGRGIKVCDRWMAYEQFFSDMGARPDGLTIERIENDKGYYKENCRWATRAEQSNNQSRNRIIEHAGQRLTLSQWASRTGIPYDTIRGRLDNGWGANEALTTVLQFQ